MRGRPERRSLGLPLHRPLYTAVARRIGSNIPGHNRCEYIINDAGQLASYVTFTRSSTATRFNSAGLLETVAANQPRYDYDPVTLQLRGLLIEEQRTNQFLNSENFTAASWAPTVAGSSTRTNLSGARGFGIGLITATSASGGIRQSLTGLVSGQQYSLSFYIESTATAITVALENGLSSYGTACTVSINATTGAVSSQAGFTRVTSTPLDAGRIYTIILPAAAGSLNANIEWRLPNGASMKFGIPQFERGAFATSPIPTATAAVTRAADLAIVSDLSLIGFNAAEGTLFAEYTASREAGTVYPGVLSLYNHIDGTSRYDLYNTPSGGNRIRGIVHNGSANQEATALTGYVAGSVYKSALAYKAGDSAVCAGGLTPGGITLTPIASGISRLGIGNRAGSNTGGNSINGWIRRARYYPRRQPNAQLQALTA